VEGLNLLIAHLISPASFANPHRTRRVVAFSCLTPLPNPLSNTSTLLKCPAAVVAASAVVAAAEVAAAQHLTLMPHPRPLPPICHRLSPVNCTAQANASPSPPFLPQLRMRVSIAATSRVIDAFSAHCPIHLMHAPPPPPFTQSGCLAREVATREANKARSGDSVTLLEHGMECCVFVCNDVR